MVGLELHQARGAIVWEEQDVHLAVGEVERERVDDNRPVVDAVGLGADVGAAGGVHVERHGRTGDYLQPELAGGEVGRGHAEVGQKRLEVDVRLHRALAVPVADVGRPLAEAAPGVIDVLVKIDVCVAGTPQNSG